MFASSQWVFVHWNESFPRSKSCIRVGLFRVNSPLFCSQWEAQLTGKDWWNCLALCLVWRSAPDLARFVFAFTFSLAARSAALCSVAHFFFSSTSRKNLLCFASIEEFWTMRKKTFINFDGCFLFGVLSKFIILCVYARKFACTNLGNIFCIVLRAARR